MDNIVEHQPVELDNRDIPVRPTQPTNINISLEDVPPNGGYGWVCTACVFLMNANTWGVNAAWGIFLDYYLSDSIFPGATQLQYALVGGLSISQALMGGSIRSDDSER